MGESWYWLASQRLADNAEYVNGEFVITTAVAKSVLGRRLRVPSNLQLKVLQELVSMGLLERRGVGGRSFFVVCAADRAGVV